MTGPPAIRGWIPSRAARSSIQEASESSAGQENGRMEQIIFSSEVVTSAAELNSLMQ
jgi:hypothetical protein